MNNNDILAFSELVKQGSFSKAAEKLFITQSALSLKIINLEKELGCKLFHRQKGIRNVELTHSGKEFLILVGKWNSLLYDMSNLQKKEINRSFKLSSLNSISTTILPEVLSNFIKTYPNVLLQTEDLSSYASYDSIEKQYVDFSIIVDQRYSLKSNCNLLFTEKMVLVSNINSQLPETLEITQLNTKYLIYCPWFLKFEQWCHFTFGKNFIPLIQIQIMEQLNFLLQDSNHWSIVPLSVAYELSKVSKLKIHTLDIAIPERQVHYLTHISPKSEDNLNTYFVNILKQRLLKLENEQIITCAFNL
ncbi:MAG: LysR family transcriptional regulator [Filifactoraceae bacterium]